MTSSTAVWSVAPMIDRTGVHFRYLVHCVAPSVRRYTEMVVAGGPLARLHRATPRGWVAAQLAGASPQTVAEASRVVEQRGFDAVNLNCGCPGPAAVAGGYGAVLMRAPERVAAIVAAVGKATALPVSVKCRLSADPGADTEADPEATLAAFVDRVAAAGCRHFIVHARAAHLGGLSPRDNRRIPTLRHDVVERLASARPGLAIELNGGVRTAVQARAAMTTGSLCGVMIGRAAYDDPLMLAELDTPHLDRDQHLERVLDAMADYLDARRDDGVPPWAVVRHMLGLFHGVAGAKRLRTALCSLRDDPTADGRALWRACRPRGGASFSRASA